MRSVVPSLVATCKEKITLCMNALKYLSGVWLAARMEYELFKSIFASINQEQSPQHKGAGHEKSTSADETEPSEWDWDQSGLDSDFQIPATPESSSPPNQAVTSPEEINQRPVKQAPANRRRAEVATNVTGVPIERPEMSSGSRESALANFLPGSLFVASDSLGTSSPSPSENVQLAQKSPNSTSDLPRFHQTTEG